MLRVVVHALLDRHGIPNLALGLRVPPATASASATLTLSSTLSQGAPGDRECVSSETLITLFGTLSQGAQGDCECVSSEMGGEAVQGAGAGGGRCWCLPCKSAPQESPLDGLDVVYHAVENVGHKAA